MIGIDFSIGSAIVSTCAKIGGELMSAVGAFAKMQCFSQFFGGNPFKIVV